LKKWLSHLGDWLSIVVTNKVFLFMLGRGICTNASYWLARWLGDVTWAKGFPLGTLVINVTGSFILGLAAVIILERLPPAYQDWYVLFGTSFCGGYSPTHIPGTVALPCSRTDVFCERTHTESFPWRSTPPLRVPRVP
jgi:CrcB protein